MDEIVPGMLLINQAVSIYRTQQAALVLITHLLLGAVVQSAPRPALSERIRIHNLITFAIMTLKRRGAGHKLEALVASCAPWMNEQVVPSYTPVHSLPISRSPCSESNTSTRRAAQHQHTSLTDADLFDLDTQLFRLDNNENSGDIWQHIDDIFRNGGSLNDSLSQREQA